MKLTKNKKSFVFILQYKSFKKKKKKRISVANF